MDELEVEVLSLSKFNSNILPKSSALPICLYSPLVQAYVERIEDPLRLDKLPALIRKWSEQSILILCKSSQIHSNSPWNEIVNCTSESTVNNSTAAMTLTHFKRTHGTINNLVRNGFAWQKTGVPLAGPVLVNWGPHVSTFTVRHTYSNISTKARWSSMPQVPSTGKADPFPEECPAPAPRSQPTWLDIKLSEWLILTDLQKLFMYTGVTLGSAWLCLCHTTAQKYEVQGPCRTRTLHQPSYQLPCSYVHGSQLWPQRHFSVYKHAQTSKRSPAAEGKNNAATTSLLPQQPMSIPDSLRTISIFPKFFTDLQYFEQPSILNQS